MKNQNTNETKTASGSCAPAPCSANRTLQFRQELESLINCHSRENGSDTPDFILADYLMGCLTAFDKATTNRAYWYGHKTQPVPAPDPNVPSSNFIGLHHNT
jgi:hypothetical protein